MTGLSYARARWYDARNASWLQEDPVGEVDSTNLYAFVGHQPNMATDPTGEIALVDNLIGGVVSVAVGMAFEAGINWVTGDESWDYSWKDAGVDFGLGFATSGLSSLGKVRYLADLGTVGKVGVRAGAEIALDTTAEVARKEWKGEDYALGDLAIGAVKNFAIGEAGAAVARKVRTGSFIGQLSGAVKPKAVPALAPSFPQSGSAEARQALIQANRAQAAALRLELGGVSAVEVQRRINNRAVDLRRPYLRQGTRSVVSAAAPRDALGRALDSNTGLVIVGKAHFGHAYGHEHRRLLRRARIRGMSQTEFNDWVNSNPGWLLLEDPVSNLSHAYEMPGIGGL